MRRIFIIVCFILLGVVDINAEVLYSNNFDSNTTGAYSASEWVADWKTNSVFFDDFVWYEITRASIIDETSDPGVPYSGKSLEVRYPSGVYGGGGQVGWIVYTADDSREDLYVSFYMKFKSDFDFVLGGKIPGPACLNPITQGGVPDSGNPADGTNGCSARGSWKSLSGENGAMTNYVYQEDGVSDPYGETLFWDDGPGGVAGRIELNNVLDEWHHYEMYIKINTVAGCSGGCKNGIIRGYYDGVLYAEKTDYRFKTVDTFNIDTFYFSTFFGGAGSQYAPSKDEYAYFDNIVVSTTRIGPEEAVTHSITGLTCSGCSH